MDPVESALVLGGLVLSWGGATASPASPGRTWATGTPGARRFLRRALLVGCLLAALLATVAVFAALILTPTMRVTLATVVLLTGQSGYLLAAATLLLTGREPLLLGALLPALAALALQVPGGSVADALGWSGERALATFRHGGDPRGGPAPATVGRARLGAPGSSSASACWWPRWWCSPRSTSWWTRTTTRCRSR